MAIIGFVQEMKAMAAFLDLSAPKAKVRRDGNTFLLDAAGVVNGDLLVLEAGRRHCRIGNLRQPYGWT